MGLRRYNYHTWSKFMVKTPDDAPKGAHYAGVMFDTVSIDTGYPEHPGTQNIVHYFAFKNQADLESWVDEATRADKKFFFFHVPNLGQAKVRVDVHLDDGTNPQHAFGHGRGD